MATMPPQTVRVQWAVRSVGGCERRVAITLPASSRTGGFPFLRCLARQLRHLCLEGGPVRRAARWVTHPVFFRGVRGRATVSVSDSEAGAAGSTREASDVYPTHKRQATARRLHGGCSGRAVASWHRTKQNDRAVAPRRPSRTLALRSASTNKGTAMRAPDSDETRLVSLWKSNSLASRTGCSQSVVMHTYT